MTKQMKLRSKDTQRAYTGDRDRNNFLEKKVSTHCLGFNFSKLCLHRTTINKRELKEKVFLTDNYKLVSSAHSQTLILNEHTLGSF